MSAKGRKKYTHLKRLGRILSWTINYTETAQKQLQKLDKKTARRNRIADYRIIVDIQDSVLCVLVLNLGNRREIYRKK